MGAGASTDSPSFDDIGKWSKEDVATEVASLGEAFEGYGKVALDNNVDGAMVVGLTEKDLEEIGVEKGVHRKKILATLSPGRRASLVAERRSNQIFLSYPRGDETTPFARSLNDFLEAAGFEVWFDAECIAGGVDFMTAIGQGIQSSRAMVAIIDEKFCGSTYCNNELAMAQGNGVQLFPILFRGTRFDQMPAGLQYMLASTNCLPFAEASGDDAGMETMLREMRQIFELSDGFGGAGGEKISMRHGGDAPVKAAVVAVIEPDDKPAVLAAAAAAAAEAKATTAAVAAVAAAAAAATAPPTLAPVPAAVPELPDVMAERPEMLSQMRGHLLGFLATSGVSLSSAKRSKVSTHGQGGVGKTTMAAALVQDPMVRRAFDRIGWVSVGQTTPTPVLMEMQRMLFQQLTGEALPPKDGATAASQLEQLQAACKGKRWLVVLDDVWDKAASKMLSCIDDASPSKLLVTTRIRGLLQGCDEVSLNLLAPAESVDLLLRQGRVDDADEAAAAAAAALIAGLCGHLPLYLSICGSIIADYEGSAEWQHELVQLLKEDRVGVIDDAAAGDDDEGGVTTTGRIVDASLKMLKDKDATATFVSLALCPEDVLCPVSVAQLVCGADADNTSKTSALVIRRSLKKLLDRNLLQGSTAEGVQMHDLVRDLMRARTGGEGIRTKQRAVVQAFIAECPPDGWGAGDATGGYAAQALLAHMGEALLPEPLEDAEAQAWLDASDNVLEHTVARCAAEAFGHEALAALGERLEAEGQPWLAAKRLAAAAITTRTSSVEAVAKEEAASTTLMRRVCDLLEKGADEGTDHPSPPPPAAAGGRRRSVAARSLEVSLRGQLSSRLGWDHEYVKAADARVQELIAAGIDTKSPALLVGAGWAQMLTNMDAGGFTPTGEENLHNFESQQLTLEKGWVSPHLKTAYDLTARNDPFWIIAAAFHTFSSCSAQHQQHELGRMLAPTHAVIDNFMRAYDFKTDHAKMGTAPMGLDFTGFCHTASFAINKYGDIGLAREWLEKLCDVYEGMDSRTDPTVFASAYYGGLAMSHSFLSRAGLGDLSLRFCKALHLTFDEVAATAAAYHGVMQFFACEWRLLLCLSMVPPPSLSLCTHALPNPFRSLLLCAARDGQDAHFQHPGVPDRADQTPSLAACTRRGGQGGDGELARRRAVLVGLRADGRAHRFDAALRRHDGRRRLRGRVRVAGALRGRRHGGAEGHQGFRVPPHHAHSRVHRHGSLPRQTWQGAGGARGVRGRHRRGAALRDAVPGDACAPRPDRARAGRGGRARIAAGGAGWLHRPHGAHTSRVQRGARVGH